MTSIGHNNPPKDRTFKKRWATALFAHPDKPMGAIARGFKLYMEMDGSGCGAVISDREFSDCCGVSERACQNFKKWLTTNGFVRIQVKGARGRANAFMALIPGEEMPALDAIIQEETAARITGKDAESKHPLPAIEPEMPATRAAASQTSAPHAGIPPRAPAQMESLRDSYTIGSEVKPPLPPRQQEAAREGETGIGHGVFVNCEAIRHKDFGVSLKAIQMQLCGTVPMETIKQVAQGHALQWAMDLEAGKPASKIVPTNTASFIRASIQRQNNESAVTDVRKTRASGKGGSKRMSLEELSAGVDAAFERQHPKVPRITHER